MTRLGSLSLIGLLIISTACGARSTSNNVGNGSNTNWLSGCNADVKCGDGVCAGGACTETCRNDDDCTHLSPDAKCAEAVPFVADDSASCDDVEPRRVCTPSCDEARDCADIGDGYACTSGACVPVTCATPSPTGACEGKTCGEDCTPCPASDPQCEVDAIVYQCNTEGTCVAGVIACTEDDCATVPANQCEGYGCVVIDGTPVTGECEPQTSAPVGCAPFDSGDSAISCAINPEDSLCYQFPTTSSPSGWQTADCQDTLCVQPECPTEQCFSPTQNTDRAYSGEVPGCPCDDVGSACVDGVALICEDGAWIAVEDGPCYPVSETDVCGAWLEDVEDCITLFDTCTVEAGKFCGRGARTESCSDGLIVDSDKNCPETAPSCAQLESGLWCASPTTALCPEHYQPTLSCVGPELRCLPVSELFMCSLRLITDAECSAEGGEVYIDPGDGSLSTVGCPTGLETTAFLTDFIEGGLCCQRPKDGGTFDGGGE